MSNSIDKWNSEMHEAMGRVVQLIDDAPRGSTFSYEVTKDVCESQSYGFRNMRPSGFETVSIRYFVDPRLRESKQLAVERAE